MNCLNKLIISVLILFPFFSNAQETKIIVAQNGQYIAIVGKTEKITDTIFVSDDDFYKISYKDIYNTPINIFKAATGEYFKTIYLKTNELTDIKYGMFSNNSNNFYLKHDKNSYTFFNIPSEKMLKTITADSIAMSSQYDSFYALTDNKIVKHSYFYDKKYFFYADAGKKIERIALTPDDKFVLAKCNDKNIYIWQRALKNDAPQKVTGQDFGIGKDGNFYISIIKGQTIQIQKFSTETNNFNFDEDKKIRHTKYIKEGKIIKSKINTKKSHFSTNQEVYVFVWNKAKKTNYTFVNMNTDKIVFELKQKRKNYKNTSINYISDSLISVKKIKNEYEIYNIYTGKKISTFNIEPSKYEAVNFVGDKNAFYINNNESKDEILSATKEEYSTEKENIISAWQNKNAYIFIDNKENDSIYYFKTAELSDKTIKYSFANVKYTDNSTKTKIKFSSAEIENMKIKDIKKIETAKTKNLLMTAKAIKINEDNTGLQFYLMDSEGNYYSGASSDEWKNIFCEIILENEYGEKEIITDYRLYENTETDNKTYLTSFVLDHSGSMSTNNVTLMQNGVLNIIKTKPKTDALNVIKFDTKINEEVSISRNTADLIKNLKINGLGGYGGSTALIDGIRKSLETLETENTYMYQNAIVLTDGFDNSSKSSKNRLLMKAIENNVSIYTIGLGSSIDINMLKTLAINTNGGYYTLKDAGIDKIFDEIYTNMKNYYSILFNPPFPGKYKITVKLCHQNFDTMTYCFDNYIPNILFTDEKKERDSIYKELTGIKDTLFSNDFNANEIYTNIEFLKLKTEFSKLAFPNIKFDYDKTTIIKDTDKELINVITFMKTYPNCMVEIQGHTDNKGGLVYNEKLSQARADKVKQLIVEQGIDIKRLKTIGYGESKPIDTNETDAGRQKNRRVEFILINEK